MNANMSTQGRNADFELHFQSLFHEGRGLAFPCNSAGQVDIDALTERARNNYFFARGLIGRDFSLPTMRPTLRH